MPDNLPPNSELEDAVQKFEEKQKEHEMLRTTSSYRAGGAGMIYSVMKFSGGLIKNERQAEYFLFTFSVILISFSGYLFFKELSPDKPKIIPRFQEDVEASVRAKLPPGVFETLPSKYDPR